MVRWASDRLFRYYYIYARPILRLLGGRTLWAHFKYTPEDYHTLSAYLYELQSEQDERGIILERQPVSAIIAINHQVEAARGSASVIFSRLLTSLGLRRKLVPAQTDAGSVPVAKKFDWRKPLRKTVRRAFRIVKHWVRSANAEELYPFTRSTVYEVLTRNGDLTVALRGFEVLGSLKSKVPAEWAAQDRFMLKLLPEIRRIERAIAGTTQQRPGDRRGLVLGLTIWREDQLDLFLRYTLPSLMAAGNLPEVSESAAISWHVIGTQSVVARLSGHAAFASPFQVRFEVVSDELAAQAVGDQAGWFQGGLTHTSFRLAKRLDADLHIVRPATVYSQNYLSNLYKVVAAKNAGLLLGSSFSAGEGVLPALDSKKSGDVIALDVWSLHSLGFEHLHPRSRSLIVDEKDLESGPVPRSAAFIWRDGANMVIHATAHPPVFVSAQLLRQDMILSYASVEKTVCRQWCKLTAVTEVTHMVQPEDHIGLIEIVSGTEPAVERIDRQRFLKEFWNDHTGSEFRLLARPCRLAVGKPSPDAAAASATERAFRKLYTEVQKLRAEHDAAAAEQSRGLNVADLVNMSDAIYRLELRQGPGSTVEMMLEDMVSSIADGKVVEDVTALDNQLIERLYINFLRLGLLSEIKALRERFQFSLSGATEVINTVIDLASNRYEKAAAAGAEWGARHGGREKFTLSATVWGDVYVRNFMNYNVRSMLAPGNIPALAQMGVCKMFIVTDVAGRDAIQSHPVYASTLKYVEWEFSLVPSEVIARIISPEMANYFYVLYGMLDHIGIFFAQKSGSSLFMIPVDAIVAESSLSNMANYRREGYECCGGGNIVANTETFLPVLEAGYAEREFIAISTEDLASLAIEHAHHYFISQVISAENIDFGRHARELFWPVPGGIEIHSCFIHPLFVASTAVARYTRMHYANVDYGMIPRIFTEPSRIKIITNTDEAYINNFASSKRRFETTGSPFEYEIFLRAHDYTYPVQKALFIHGQTLKCRYNGITPNRQVAADVEALWTMLSKTRSAP